MSIGIEQGLAPGYFVSYSRHQEDIALLLKGLLAESARSVWYDRDGIAVGETWRDEIRRGIAGADELVLLLSKDSIASEMVAEEIALARAAGKLVRPIAIAPISGDLPPHLRDIHHVDLSDIVGRPDLLRLRLSELFGEKADDDSPEALLKLRACRRISPRFSLDFTSAEGRIAAQGHAAQLERLRSGYAQSSTIQLNAGLMHCAAGQWETGLALLRSYARAANNLAGWYFLALHLLRCEPARNAPLARVREALEAIGAALQFGANPLAILTAAILETGGANLGARNLERRMEAFAAALSPQLDPPGEYVRALWCLKPSLAELGFLWSTGEGAHQGDRVVTDETEAPNRRNVRKFFHYNVMKEEPERPVNMQLVLVVGFIALLVGAGAGSGAAAVLLGLVAAGITFAVDRAQANATLLSSRDEIGRNHARFLELADETRKIQSADLTKAMVRIFERSQLDREKLRILNHAYVFADEVRLLEEETQERKFADLMNKSYRMISAGDISNRRFRKIRWTHSGADELFFNPTRLVILFLTDTQLVVCEVQVDSMDGNLREEVQRFALSKIVNVHFVAERTRLDASRENLVQMAEDLQLDQDKIEEIKRTFEQNETQDDHWKQDIVETFLKITRVDGAALTVPVKSQVYFGKSESVLDGDCALDEEEVKVDRLVNELNRVVESG